MMNFLKKRLNQKGFTLVELLIVIAVLGIIAGIGVSSMTGITKSFKEKADQETAKIIARQVEILILAGDITADTDNAGLRKKITNLPEKMQTSDAEYSFSVSGVGTATATVTFTSTGMTDITVSITGLKAGEEAPGGTSGGTSGGTEG